MNPEKIALILIGFQNDYFATDGILHGVIDESSKATQAVENIVHLLEQLVHTSVLIVATPIIFTQDYQELVEPVGILKTIKEVGAFQAATKGSEMIEQLLPFRSDILEIPGKRGFNAFTGTSLKEVLQDNQIKNVVLAGAVTSICIDSTGRSAHEQGYQVSVLADCTSARTVFEQNFYLGDVFPLYAEVISAAKFLQNLGVDV